MTMPKLLTKKEVADLLGVSRRQVQKLVAEKKLSAQRLGHKTLRFRPEAIERYLRTVTT